jgi:hypothetical protein
MKRDSFIIDSAFRINVMNYECRVNPLSVDPSPLINFNIANNLAARHSCYSYSAIMESGKNYSISKKPQQESEDLITNETTCCHF